MSLQKAKAGTFVIERSYPVPPRRVFQAWADAKARAAWFKGPAPWQAVIREQDFRVGGAERVRGDFGNGRTSDFRARYSDIVPDERIIFTYDMFVSDVLLSVSVSTVEFAPQGAGTRMTYTEQGVYLDPQYAESSREEGTVFLFNQLAATLAS